ncbi:MAG: multicopper oxidase family protein [Candidatus Moraniibacteriota bacterium]
MNKKYLGIILLAAASALGLWLAFGGQVSDEGIERLGTADQAGKSGTFSRDTAGLSAAKPTETVALKDGDAYAMEIDAVKKTIAGKSVKMLGYNGSVPGPTLLIPEGAEVTIDLKNEGDIATTLHAHGVRMDNAFDGVPGVTQKEIAPGESFSYRLRFSDPGIFWYHPHVRTDYALESGLYANIIVTPKDSSYFPPANRETALILDDIALDKDGLLPFRKDVADHTLMGRFGNVMLVNGMTDYALSAKQGEVVRLYLTSAANTRLFNFTLPGAKMKLVGADVGRYEKETFVDEVLIAPGERRVVDVFFEKSGKYALEHRTPDKGYALGTVSVSAETANPSYAQAFSVLRTNAAVADELGNLMDAYLAKAPDKNLNLSLDMNEEMRKGMPQGMHSMGGGMVMSDAGMGMGDDGDAFEWEDTMAGMNALSTSAMLQWKLVDNVSGKANMDIADWKFKVGDKVKIRIFNDPQSLHPMQHPIHFHGQRLMVLSTNGVKNDNPVWADTVLVAKGDTVDILLDTPNPGVWMAHCHILEHAESGMMLSFKVE